MKLGTVEVPRNPGLRKEKVVHISEKGFDALSYCRRGPLLEMRW